MFSILSLSAFCSYFALATSSVSCRTFIIKSSFLEGKIEVIGSPADLVFIAKDGGDIFCNACQINNVNRLAFLAATGSMIDAIDSENIDEIGDLTTPPNGKVRIFSMIAPGAMVDVLAYHFSLWGTIDTMVDEDANNPVRFVGDEVGNTDPSTGQFTSPANGTGRIASGAVDIKYGDINWNYESNRVNTVTPSPTVNGLSGNIRSATVRITSSRLNWFFTDIDTRADRLATRMQNGQVVVPKEGVYIYTHNLNDSGLNGDIKTNGPLQFVADNEIYWDNGLNIDANEIKVATTADFLNEAKIDTNKMEVSAQDFVNTGVIMLPSNGQFLAQVEGNIINRSGTITGPEFNESNNSTNQSRIILSAKNGFVRNGLAHVSDKSDIKTNRPVTLSNCDDNCETQMNPLHDIQNVMNVGAYYRYDIDTSLTQKGDVYVPSTLRANEILIDAINIENINPYYEISALITGSCPGYTLEVGTSDHCFVLSSLYKNQITIEAKSLLLFKARRAIINASGSMATIDAQNSLMQLQADSIVNERYRILSMLANGRTEKATFVDHAVIYKEGLKLDAYVLSPLGRIHAYQHAIFESRHFSNLVSDVFVGGDTRFAVGDGRSISIQDQLFEKWSVYAFEGSICQAIRRDQTEAVNFYEVDAHGNTQIVKTAIFREDELASLRCNALYEFADAATRTYFPKKHDPYYYKYATDEYQKNYFKSLLGHPNSLDNYSINKFIGDELLDNQPAYRARYHFNRAKQGENSRMVVKNINAIYDTGSNALLTGNFLYLSLDDLLGLNRSSDVYVTKDQNNLSTTVVTEYDHSGQILLTHTSDHQEPTLNEVRVTEIQKITTTKQIDTGTLAPVMVGGITIFVPVIKEEVSYREVHVDRGLEALYDVLERFFNKMYELLKNTLANIL